MRKVTKDYDVYEFDELEEESQNKVVTDIITSVLEIFDDEDVWDGNEFAPNVKKAIDKADAMKTPWFTHEYVYEYAKDDILETARSREYLEDGTIFYDSISKGKRKEKHKGARR
jgi:hypothetical protein